MSGAEMSVLGRISSYGHLNFLDTFLDIVKSISSAQLDYKYDKIFAFSCFQSCWNQEKPNSGLLTPLITASGTGTEPCKLEYFL